MENNIYYTCQELINRNVSTQFLNWNISKVGIFYSCSLIEGRPFGKNKRVIISEDSFKLLIAFAHKVKDSVESEPEYLTYEDVLFLYPQTTAFHWTPTVIGTLCHSTLLCGKRSRKEDCNLVSIPSVENLIAFTAQRLRKFINMPIKPIR